MSWRRWSQPPNETSRADRQLVHGDFWDDNGLFREGRIVLVTDLDFMGVRPRVDDLALIPVATRTRPYTTASSPTLASTA